MNATRNEGRPSRRKSSAHETLGRGVFFHLPIFGLVVYPHTRGGRPPLRLQLDDPNRGSHRRGTLLCTVCACLVPRCFFAWYIVEPRPILFENILPRETTPPVCCPKTSFAHFRAKQQAHGRHHRGYTCVLNRRKALPKHTCFLSTHRLASLERERWRGSYDM